MSDTEESQRILEVLSRARSEIERLKRPKDQRIAVVGMAGRFPGAESVAAFWEMLRDGVCGVRDLTEGELLEAGVPRSEFEKSDYVRRFASIENPTHFDASFFGYAPGEADVLDPQHRVFLECAWTALENAGYDPSQYDGRIGVYAGAALNSYLVNLHNDRKTRESVNQVQAVVSNVMGLMPTRVSYHLDLKGPSCGVQTGCSTSLVAIHNACRSLLDGDCDMALAGGVTIGQATPEGYLFEEAGIASPDGLCRAFDAEGKGTIFGNGVGIVVLKPLEAALADGDDIRAVILGSAINNDGSDKVGLLAPSVNGQADAIRQAVKRAGIEPGSISYVEAHGTATELGDPVEFMALDQAIGDGLAQDGSRCRIGSVKTNVGHLDAAAGVVGLIKTVLSLQHKQLPPSLNFSKAHPQIDFEARPFQVNAELSDWVDGSGHRRAGVSSFGMGGTNAHVVLEEAPERTAEAATEREWHLLPLSAKTESALTNRQSLLIDDLTERTRPLADVAFTLQVGRQAMKHRRVVVCQAGEELREQGETKVVDAVGSPVFLFSGQGSQYPGMTRQLYEREARFRECIDECDEILGSSLDLKKLLYGDADASELKKTENAQPALFAVEYALAQLLLDWGVKPVAMIGHSLGEYVAACLAGVFELKDALELVRFRGEVMQNCDSGAMLAVATDEAGVQP
ncbi:MAG: polyketide synthase, partial [Verrucomicrobiales bacterium]|nr:polyketide synthase [Verrucomicrobiales bacterium]